MSLEYKRDFCKSSMKKITRLIEELTKGMDSFHESRPKRPLSIRSNADPFVIRETKCKQDSALHTLGWLEATKPRDAKCL